VKIRTPKAIKARCTAARVERCWPKVECTNRTSPSGALVLSLQSRQTRPACIPNGKKKRLVLER
jgi:hypothetical protein